MILKWALIIVCMLTVLILGYGLYTRLVANPKVMEELRQQPNGARAERVMVLTLPDGTEVPVNYLREDGRVFAGSDGRWWQAFQGDGAPVTLLIKGETLTGYATVELDDQATINDIFSRLRPAASWVPEALDAKLVVITLDQATR